MGVSKSLEIRSGGICELCANGQSVVEFTVSPKEDKIDNQVAICSFCEENLGNKNARDHWQCLSSSIWSEVPVVQVLSYRLLLGMKDQSWSLNILEMVDLDEDLIQWAASMYESASVHMDSYGNVLESGDNVVLTQSLKVKGTNFTVSKGTVVKKIRLVANNMDQIEGKINDQVIVILTQFVKKN
jgi:protein PhnA